MSNIQTGAERMPHDLSHLGFLAGQIGRLITISTTPVIAGDFFELVAVGALRLSPLRRGLAIYSTVDIFTFYVPHRHNGDMYVDGHKAASDVRDEFVSVTEKLMDELAQCYNVLPQLDINNTIDHRPEGDE